MIIRIPKKINFIFLILIFFPIYQFSQSGGTTSSSLNLNKLTPLSPNSAAFEKYGVVPVNLSSGVITPSIPLYSIKLGNNNFDININYSSQGLRVDETPTNLGMGWSLNLGSITRNVKDLPDDEYQRIREVNQITGEDNYNIGHTLANVDGIDSERDIFTINVDGYNSKFIIDSDDFLNLSIKKLSLDNVKIELINLLSNESLAHKIKVTTPNGNVYFFGGNNGMEKCFTRPYQLSQIPPSIYPTAWLLSRVEYVDGNFININYSKASVTYTDGISQTALIKFNVPTTKDSGLPQAIPPNTQLTYNHVTIASPMSIYTSGNEVYTFEISSFNNFLDGTFPKISSISKLNGGKLVKKYEFNFEDFQSINIGDNTYSTIVKRPFLKKIINKDINSNEINSHSLEYYSPESLPNRFSFAQDILGYFNGKSNKNFIFNSLKDYTNLDDFYQIKQTEEEFNNFIFNASGDRKPNINFSKYGTLKKIVYPTKGYTEFEYEGNLTNIREKIYPPYNTATYIEITPSALSPITVTKTINVTVPFNQKFYITSYYNTKNNVDPESSICDPDPIHDKSVLSIYDENNQLVNIITISDLGNMSSTTTENFSMGSSSFFETNSQVRKYAELKAGKIYKIKLINRKCMYSKVQFAYYDSLPYDGDYVEAGGLRIKSVKNYDSNNELISKKKYEYENGNYTVGKPTSVLDLKDISIALSNESNTAIVGYVDTKSYTLSSNTRWSLRNLSGEFYTYSKVTEVIKDKNENSLGKIEHYFDAGQNAIPTSIQNFSTSSSNITDLKYKINEIKTEIYDSQNNILKRVNNNYEINYSTAPIQLKSYTSKATLETKCAKYTSPNSYTNCPEGVLYGLSLTDSRWWSVMMTYAKAVWEYPRSQVSTEFLNGVPMTTTTSYYYDNLSHYQLTREETSLPDGTIQKKLNNYAHEKNNQYLIDKNMIGIPLQTTVTKTANGITKTLSDVETKFPISQSDADTRTSGLPLPYEVLSKDFQGNYIKEVSYKKYDNKGNLQEYIIKPDVNGNGIPVTIIWGYNQTQPIAKIEGATYTQVEQYIADIINKSNNDIDQSSENTLINALDAFRNNTNLINYKITTYTYDPLIGVTSITPPNGVREIYKYDSANRLQSIVDVNGKILKEYKYNYKQ